MNAAVYPPQLNEVHHQTESPSACAERLSVLDGRNAGYWTLSSTVPPSPGWTASSQVSTPDLTSQPSVQKANRMPIAGCHPRTLPAAKTNQRPWVLDESLFESSDEYSPAIS